MTTTQTVAVEREFERDYVLLNQRVNQIHLRLPELGNIAACSILSIFILGGCDYVSSFYNISYTRLIDAFMDYSSEFCHPNQPLVHFPCDATGRYHIEIVQHAFFKLISFVYMDKYKTLWKHIQPTPPLLLRSFTISGSNMSAELMDLLQWLGYDMKKQNKVTTIDEWMELTRRITYYNNHGSQNLYRNMLPSCTSLELHRRRSEFVLRCATESCLPLSDTYLLANGYGWEVVNGKVCIKWQV
jgi:hypothetical protein